jgi:phage terminase large subunit GpA-like protein
LPDADCPQRTGEVERNKKVIMCSTRTVDGESGILAAWNTSDQREYFVSCTLCNHFQILVLSDGTDGGLVWPEDEQRRRVGPTGQPGARRRNTGHRGANG